MRILKKTLILLVAVIFTACGGVASTWQEHYDLGMKYLSEGNYEEAILSFTAAIEIDPKMPLAFIGRADAYIGLGETEENLMAALADYEEAVELDDTNPDAYLGIADVYIRQGEYEKAINILELALEKTNNAQSIIDKIEEIKSGVYIDSSKNIRRNNTYDLEGVLISYTEYDYDYLGRRSAWKNYTREWDDNKESYSSAMILENSCQVTFDEEGRVNKYQFYDANGLPSEYDTFVYNESNLKSEQYRYTSEGALDCYFYFYYDEQGRRVKYEGYDPDGTMYGYWVSEYDDKGNFIREKGYNPDGTWDEYSVYE